MMSWQFGALQAGLEPDVEAEGMRDGVAFKVTVRMGEMVESGGEEG